MFYVYTFCSFYLSLLYMSLRYLTGYFLLFSIFTYMLYKSLFEFYIYIYTYIYIYIYIYTYILLSSVTDPLTPLPLSTLPDTPTLLKPTAIPTAQSKFQSALFSVLCMTFQVQLSFVVTLLNVFVYLFAF